MREIIFRGKRKDNGEWIFGYYFQTQNLFSDDGFPITHHISDLPPFGVEVDAETVGQFTGLTDKNGKRIFEGDIIKDCNGKQSSVSVVKFGDYYPEMFYKMLDMFCPGKRHVPSFGFYAESIDKHEEMILFQSQCIEVIGNIHDNQELLCNTKMPRKVAISGRGDADGRI